MQWFPDGSLLTTYRWDTLSRVASLQFLLVNGDRHGEAVLSSGHRLSVADMRWNQVSIQNQTDSVQHISVRPSQGSSMHTSLLAVLLYMAEEPLTLAGPKAQFLRLYYRSNYHWCVSPVACTRFVLCLGDGVLICSSSSISLMHVGCGMAA